MIGSIIRHVYNLDAGKMYKREYEFYYKQAINQLAFNLSGETKHLFQIDETKDITDRAANKIRELKEQGKWDAYGTPN